MFRYHSMDLEIEQMPIIRDDEVRLSDNAVNTISRAVSYMLDRHGSESDISQTFRIREDGGLLLTLKMDDGSGMQIIKIGPTHWMPTNLTLH